MYVKLLILPTFVVAAVAAAASVSASASSAAPDDVIDLTQEPGIPLDSVQPSDLVGAKFFIGDVDLGKFEDVDDAAFWVNNTAAEHHDRAEESNDNATVAADAADEEAALLEFEKASPAEFTSALSGTFQKRGNAAGDLFNKWMRRRKRREHHKYMKELHKAQRAQRQEQRRQRASARAAKRMIEKVMGVVVKGEKKHKKVKHHVAKYSCEWYQRRHIAFCNGAGMGHGNFPPP